MAVAPRQIAPSDIEGAQGHVTLPLKLWGVKANGLRLTNLTTTSGSAVVSSPSYSFTAADVGKLITIAGAGAAGAVLNATILSASGGAATLSTSAGTSLAGSGVTTFGSDDSAALQNAVDAAQALGIRMLFHSGGISIIAASVTWRSGISLSGAGVGTSVFKWISTTDMTAAIFQALDRPGSDPYLNNEFFGFECDGSAATQATYSVAGKAFYMQHMRRASFHDLYVHDFPATGIGVDFLVESFIYGNTVNGNGRLNNLSQPGGAGIGIGTANDPNESVTITGNVCIDNGRYSIFEETQLVAQSSARVVISNNIVINTTSNGHGIGACGSIGTVITGNRVTGPLGSSLSGGTGIVVNNGTLFHTPGIEGVIADNVVSGFGNGIHIDYGVTSAGAVYSRWVVTGNKVSEARFSGIQCTSNASHNFNTVNITGNTVGNCGTAGIFLTGAGTFKNVAVNDNMLANNGLYTASAFAQAGIAINAPVDRFTCIGNTAWDDYLSKQLYGLSINTAKAVTKATIKANNFRDNATSALKILGTLAGEVADNSGYNPVGPTTVTVGASPWTYTAGVTPETLYIKGGTVSDVSLGGVSVASATGVAVTLPPNGSVVVTYSSAPTAVADRG